jgi:NAD(P)-dependent dehydrogenase (short-subunit alcohol dehydrogenase family)
MTKILDGKRALVTGGSRGIGRAIAEAFVSAGARMVIADIEGAAAAAEEIGRGTVGVACDVASSESVAAGIAEAVRALGGLDLLVNNAGVGSLAPLHELTEEEFDRVVAVNLRGTWLVYKHAVPRWSTAAGRSSTLRPFPAWWGSRCWASTQPPKAL